MSHTPHTLAEDFPDKVEQIQTLRRSDGHFDRLCENYHTINRAVHRAETDIEPTSDQHLVEMRKTRMTLKDEIAARLADT
ncbi:YdcH family protein [Jannaschia marina]|uniref:YdcH family protein n=1 Tax=Jannaschia marina TaxID=2741674 RepID=UPI0015CB04DC|nr:DUF465 domain-containing protein [Jannaschia marina]